MQLPFEHPEALSFVLSVQREFRIPLENMSCAGDEGDQYFGSTFAKDPDALYTPGSELREAADRFKAWYKAFPIMRVAVSNHPIRYLKRAMEAGLPQEVIRAWKEIIGAPDGWQWKDKWIYDTEHRFCMVHGMGYSGQFGHIKAAQDNRMSTVIGHLHAFGGAAHTDTVGGAPIWGLNTGCLIDVDAYAFQYGKYSRNKPTLGMGVVIDGGRTPIFVPFSG